MGSICSPVLTTVGFEAVVGQCCDSKRPASSCKSVRGYLQQLQLLHQLPWQDCTEYQAEIELRLDMVNELVLI